MNSVARISASTSVAIVGAGPVGLSLALGLARQGVRSVLFERKGTTSRTSKAPSVHVRTCEILRQWGVEERFLAEGHVWNPVIMHSVAEGCGPLIELDFSELVPEAEHPGVLILEQSEIERLLLEAVRESGMCDVHFEAEVVAVDQDAQGVRLTIRGAEGESSLRADFAVGCDGASSTVREALGLPFEGSTYSLRPMLADVEVDDERDDLPQPRAWTGRGGYAFAARLRPSLWRIVNLARSDPEHDEVPDEEVREWSERLLGPGPAPVVWASRFQIHVRASPRFRVSRVLLAGDAAHVHSPASGLGMNGGIHDAHNLAWKLAGALNGGDAERLLDSYEVERRAAVVETTSRYTDRFTRTFLATPPVVREAAWAGLRTLMGIARLRRALLRRTAMVDVEYPPSPLLGRRDRAAGVRLPNPLLSGPEGRHVRLYELLPNAPVLLDVGQEACASESEDLPVERVIRIGRGGYEDPSGLLRGLLADLDGWILVRPDMHVAWARRRREGTEREGMEEAVRHAVGLWRARSIDRFVDGRIAESQESRDALGMLQQLGILPYGVGARSSTRTAPRRSA